MVWHADTALPVRYGTGGDPGGFSYGDYLRCGAIAARSPIMVAVRSYARKAGCARCVQWISNPVRVWLAARCADAQRGAQIHLQGCLLKGRRSDTPFTRGYNAGQVIRVPVAHGEGNYIAMPKPSRGSKARGVCSIAMFHRGKVDERWNVNGATNSIAGILNSGCNVLA